MYAIPCVTGCTLDGPALLSPAHSFSARRGHEGVRSNTTTITVRPLSLPSFCFNTKHFAAVAVDSKGVCPV